MEVMEGQVAVVMEVMAWVEDHLADGLHHPVSLVHHQPPHVAQVEGGAGAEGVGQPAGRHHQHVEQLVHLARHPAPHQRLLRHRRLAARQQLGAQPAGLAVGGEHLEHLEGEVLGGEDGHGPGAGHQPPGEARHNGQHEGEGLAGAGGRGDAEIWRAEAGVEGGEGEEAGEDLPLHGEQPGDALGGEAAGEGRRQPRHLPHRHLVTCQVHLAQILVRRNYIKHLRDLFHLDNVGVGEPVGEHPGHLPPLAVGAVTQHSEPLRPLPSSLGLLLRSLSSLLFGLFFGFITIDF